MKSILSDHILGVTKVECYSGKHKLTKTMYLSSYAKSDYSDLIKYSLSHNITSPSEGGILCNLLAYTQTNPSKLDNLTLLGGPENTEVLDVIERFGVFTTSRSSLSAPPTTREFFGSVQSGAENVSVILLSVTSGVSYLKLYNRGEEVGVIYLTLDPEVNDIPETLEDITEKN